MALLTTLAYSAILATRVRTDLRSPSIPIRMPTPRRQTRILILVTPNAPENAGAAPNRTTALAATHRRSPTPRRYCLTAPTSPPRCSAPPFVSAPHGQFPAEHLPQTEPLQLAILCFSFPLHDSDSCPALTICRRVRFLHAPLHPLPTPGPARGTSRRTHRTPQCSSGVSAQNHRLSFLHPTATTAVPTAVISPAIVAPRAAPPRARASRGEERGSGAGKYSQHPASAATAVASPTHLVETRRITPATASLKLQKGQTGGIVQRTGCARALYCPRDWWRVRCKGCTCAHLVRAGQCNTLRGCAEGAGARGDDRMPWRGRRRAGCPNPHVVLRNTAEDTPPCA
ncbi:hypothetical protein DFH06DRAFT_324832 [Mycena polygramma]|nr:hypothetical protein DFH06DRAFT_324832 [Mycena polygramma]